SVLASSAETNDRSRLQHLLKQARPTIVHAAPDALPNLIESAVPGHSLGKVLCERRGLPPELAGRLLTCSTEVWELHGSLETGAVVGTQLLREPYDLRFCGEPLTGIAYLVLDDALQVPPIGCAGQLHLEIDGERVRTADAARMRLDGAVEIINEA